MASSNEKLYRAGRIIAAALLVLGAIHEVIRPAPDELVPGPATAAAFVAVAVLLLVRPGWAYVPAILLAAEQMWRRGLDLSRSFLGEAPLDGWALAVCIFFPTLVTVLYIERTEGAERAAT